jgi:tetratricopeptide (TPR) repeat protein
MEIGNCRWQARIDLRAAYSHNESSNERGSSKLHSGFYCLLSCVCLAAQSSTAILQLEAAARAHLAARDAAAALADYQRLLSLNPKSAMYEDETGFWLVATNRVAAGISHLKKATELDAKLTVAWYHLGVAQCLAREIDVCVTNLQRAVKLAGSGAKFVGGRCALGIFENRIRRPARRSKVPAL